MQPGQKEALRTSVDSVRTARAIDPIVWGEDIGGSFRWQVIHFESHKSSHSDVSEELSKPQLNRNLGEGRIEHER